MAMSLEDEQSSLRESIPQIGERTGNSGIPDEGASEIHRQSQESNTAYGINSRNRTRAY